MKEYDVVIVGSGSGTNLLAGALSHNKTVALVDKGPVGGTCLNVGCIPSKLIVFPADRIMEIRESEKLGITVEIKGIDFHGIMDRMRTSIKKSHDRIQKALDQAEGFDFYFGEAHFSGEYTLEVNGETITGKTIFLASGARPLIPPIKGLEDIGYLTNETALQLTERPESMAIIGGGYVAAEFAHFFEAVGTKVTVIQRNNRLVPEEEPEVSDLLKKALGRRMTIHTGAEAVEVRQTGSGSTVTVRERASGRRAEITVQQVMLASGRKSNADTLLVENSGIKTDDRGYIVVDEFLETTKKGIWAFGDAIGEKMFRHAANHEADLAWHNAVHGKRSRVDYSAMPHAVFSWPEIASVGMTEEQAVKHMGKQNLLVGKAKYTDVTWGEAMQEIEGFAKTIVHRESGKIIGYHIIGPQASVLIQEVVNAMAAGGNLRSVARGIHIHPALSEVVLSPFTELEEPN